MLFFYSTAIVFNRNFPAFPIFDIANMVTLALLIHFNQSVTTGTTNKYHVYDGRESLVESSYLLSKIMIMATRLLCSFFELVQLAPFDAPSRKALLLLRDFGQFGPKVKSLRLSMWLLRCSDVNMYIKKHLDWLMGVHNIQDKIPFSIF